MMEAIAVLSIFFACTFINDYMLQRMFNEPLEEEKQE
jgi:hypothetical protein